MAVPETSLALLAASEPTRPCPSPSPSEDLASSVPEALIVPFHANPELGFLYLPPGRNDFVIIDRLENLPAMAKWPNWQRRPPGSQAAACFHVTAIPGKGQGMVASRDIKQGEIIVEERPLYVTRCDVDPASDGTIEAAAIEHLSPEAKARFLSLVNSQDPPIHPLPGRLLSNMFMVDFDYESTDENVCGGVYEFICRANQDCVPSTHYHFDFEHFTGRMFAARDIPAGEEVTITYAPINASGAMRRELLSRKYRFDCLCPSCTLSPELEAKSDERRAELKRFDLFVRGGGMPSYPLLKDALAAAETEGLASERAHVLKSGTLAIANSGQMELAMEWSRKATEAWFLLEGPDSFFSKKAQQQEADLKALAADKESSGRRAAMSKAKQVPTPTPEDEEADALIARILAAAAKLGEQVAEREEAGLPDSDSDSD